MPSDYEKLMGLREQGQGSGSEIASLHALYKAYAQTNEIRPGQIVRWKTGLRPQWGMDYSHPAIILRIRRESGEVCIGSIEEDGLSSITWADPNCLEPFE